MKNKYLIFYIFVFTFLFFGDVSMVSAANVYYSIGQTAADLKTDNPTLTITSGGAGTFSIAQAGNIGVGDRVTYNGTQIAYISAKTNDDSKRWTLVTATGSAAPNVANATVNSITREFTSLASAIAGASNAQHLNSTNLVASATILHLPSYYDSGSDTSAVDVAGYTASQDYYIKIYTPSNTSTEVNFSQRHKGRWDDTKYNIQVSGHLIYGITIHTPYTRVDGLQVRWASPGTDHYGIGILIVANEGRISNSITRAYMDTEYGYARGVVVADSSNGHKYRIYNTIAMGEGVDSYNKTGFQFYGLTLGTVYVYNCTAVNNRNNFLQDGGKTVIANNNLAQNAYQSDYSGNFTNTSHNISQDNTSPDVSFRNKKVLFVDFAAGDFHLDNRDLVARNAGTEVSVIDTSLSYTTDIDGTNRSYPWDIGADETTIPIYRSVGPGATESLAVGGSNSLSVTNSIATFANPLPDNVGIGDALQYDRDNNGVVETLAFVHERISSTSFIIASSIGLTPLNTDANDNDWAIYRAYTSLINAEKGTENSSIDASLVNFDTFSGGRDIVATDMQWNLVCYANGTNGDTFSVNTHIGSGWITGRNNFLNIYTPQYQNEVGVSQRHKGKFDNTKYFLNNISSTQFVSFNVNGGDQFIRIEGMQIVKNGSATSTGGISVTLTSGGTTGETYVLNNLIESQSQVRFSQGIHTESNATTYIYNNIILKTGAGGIRIDSYEGTAYVYNNTVNDVASYWGINNYTVGGTLIAKNNIVQNTSSSNYSGTLDPSSSNNISQDNSSPNVAYRSKTVLFVDAPNGDLHLSPNDTSARNAGENLQKDSILKFSNDIDGQERAGLWDIGADEFMETQLQNESANSDNNLLAHWTFDGNDIKGNIAKDSSKNERDLLIANFVPTIGKLGQAFNFDGASSQADLSSIIDGAKTISFWIKTDVTAANKIINIDSTRYIEISSGFITANGFPSANIYVDGAPGGAIGSDWHLVTIVDAAGFNVPEFNIGKVGTNFFQGSIDDVRLYSQSLSDSYIMTLFQIGKNKIIAPESSIGNKNGLLGYWSFDGNSVNGSVVNDLSGNGNNGIISGAYPDLGKIGQSLKFDGGTNVVDTNVSLNGNFTIAAWIKKNTTDVNSGYIAAATNNTWFLNVTTGNVRFYNGSAWSSYTTKNVADGDWHHIVYTSDGSKIIGYIDGVQDAEDVLQSPSATNGIQIGRRDTVFGFIGSIDEFKVYSRVLSAKEIGELYNLGKTSIRK